VHGVGDRLRLCPVRGCERESPDHPFSQYRNLVGHMKRIHNCSPTVHKIDGCTGSCKGGSSRIVVKERLAATMTEAVIPALQPDINDPTTESSITSGTPQVV